MPKAPTHALIWSAKHGLYELFPADPLLPHVVPGEEELWRTWLTTHTSFTFQGQAGRLNVLKESRPRGSGYWYAYQTRERRTRKHYLGLTETLSLARLEETARTLSYRPGTMQVLRPERALPSSKLSPPQLPNSLVERERLLAMLNGALSTPLTLLSAPAGFGKTTLLSVWALRQKTQVAWLSLDELDTSPTRFWVGLIAALRRSPNLAANFGETVVMLLQAPQPPALSSILTALLHALDSHNAHPAPIVLVMDDYQVISDPAIHEGLVFFLEHQPAHLHLILASRVDPDLPLARWRVRGQLTEIRADELRFQEAEAGYYLRQLLSPPPSEEEVRGLVSRTEGWIAGLHLATLALQKHEDRAAFLQAFTGSQRYLLDYVQEEILARLPTRVRDFMLHVAILSRLDASVCQAVTAYPERQTSQQMLVFLERANLFLTPLDEERRSYRLHDLFREALLSTLHAKQPELMPLLHCRAADFYEGQGEWIEAIAHRLAASDFSAAAHLMEQTVEQFWLHGEAETIARRVLALPEPPVHAHARLALTTALYLLNTVTQTTREQRERRYQLARQLMARVEILLQREADEDALLHRRLRLLRAQMAWYEAMVTWEQERFNILYREIEELDQDEEVIWQIHPIFCRFILYHSIRQEGAVLVPGLLEARERMIRSSSHFATILVRRWLAVVALEAGKLHLAYEESLAALTLIEQTAGYALLKGYFEIVMARVLYQWNRLEEARDLLHTALHNATTWQHLDVLGWGYVELMQVEIARRAWSEAQQAQHGFEQLMQRGRYRDHIGWLPTMQAHWWLAQEQLGEASDWATSILFPKGAWEYSVYNAFPVVIRVYFARRSFREALTLLDSFSTHLDRQSNIRITITYLAQLLIALHQMGESERVFEVAVRLLALTEAEGYLRVYVDEGEPMRQALLALLTPHSEQQELAPSTISYVSKLLAAFKQGEQGASASPAVAFTAEPVLSSAGQASGVSSLPGISLTCREQEVLRLLSTGASNQEIARILVISLNTVKKHVSSLLSKLGVANRTQAIAQARAHSLL